MRIVSLPISKSQRTHSLVIGDVAIPALPLLIAIFFFGFAAAPTWSDVRDKARLASDGEVTSARIVALHGNDHDAATYTYRVDGETHEDSNTPLWVEDRKELRIDGETDVVYDPRDPERNVLGDPSRAMRSAAFFAILATAFSLFLAIAGIIVATRAWRKDPRSS